MERPMSKIIHEQFKVQARFSNTLWMTTPISYDTVDEAIEAMKDKQTRNPAAMRVVRVSEEVVATADRRIDERRTD